MTGIGCDDQISNSFSAPLLPCAFEFQVKLTQPYDRCLEYLLTLTQDVDPIEILGKDKFSTLVDTAPTGTNWTIWTRGYVQKMLHIRKSSFSRRLKTSQLLNVLLAVRDELVVSSTKTTMRGISIPNIAPLNGDFRKGNDHYHYQHQLANGEHDYRNGLANRHQPFTSVPLEPCSTHPLDFQADHSWITENQPALQLAGDSCNPVRPHSTQAAMFHVHPSNDTLSHNPSHSRFHSRSFEHDRYLNSPSSLLIEFSSTGSVTPSTLSSSMYGPASSEFTEAVNINPNVHTSTSRGMEPNSLYFGNTRDFFSEYSNSAYSKDNLTTGSIHTQESIGANRQSPISGCFDIPTKIQDFCTESQFGSVNSYVAPGPSPDSMRAYETRRLSNTLESDNMSGIQNYRSPYWRTHRYNSYDSSSEIGTEFYMGSEAPFDRDAHSRPVSPRFEYKESPVLGKRMTEFGPFEGSNGKRFSPPQLTMGSLHAGLTLSPSPFVTLAEVSSKMTSDMPPTSLHGHLNNHSPKDDTRQHQFKQPNQFSQLPQLPQIHNTSSILSNIASLISPNPLSETSFDTMLRTSQSIFNAPINAEIQKPVLSAPFIARSSADDFEKIPRTSDLGNPLASFNIDLSSNHIQNPTALPFFGRSTTNSSTYFQPHSIEDHMTNGVCTDHLKLSPESAQPIDINLQRRMFSFSGPVRLDDANTTQGLPCSTANLFHQPAFGLLPSSTVSGKPSAPLLLDISQNYFSQPLKSPQYRSSHSPLDVL
ncbi:hypothetical protein O5D80_007035 [Batrachochytrium dendrobatidis]|nr:hypothetical protein O5D80_007035 [Batrachochytrium dendrobatidis]